MELRPDTLFWEGWAIPQHTNEPASLRNLGFRTAPAVPPAAGCGLQSSGTLEVGGQDSECLFVQFAISRETQCAKHTGNPFQYATAAADDDRFIVHMHICPGGTGYQLATDGRS